MFSLKEQLIFLKLEKVSLNNLWQYFQQILILEFQFLDLDYSQCQQVVQCLIENGLWPDKYRTIYRKLFDQHEEFHLQLRKLSQQAIMIGENNYPKLWLEIPQPPLLIYFQGNIQQIHQPLISLIGSRQTSEYGRQFAKTISQQIVQAGWQVVGGLNAGTGITSHQAAIQEKKNSTIGILATGLKKVYPDENAQLQNHMADQQLLLTEFLPGEKAHKHHFIMQNRLIAGISPVSILIEAPRKDPALYITHFALEFNREIFALPGRLSDPLSLGCNHLIANGARPIVGLKQLFQDLTYIFKANGSL